MGYRIHYDVSQKAVHYKSDVQKEIIQAINCSHCDDTPDEITFIISGVTNCVCANWGGAYGSAKSSNAADAVNGTHVLQWVEEDVEEGFCYWRKHLDTTAYSIRKYGSSDCSGAYGDADCSYFRIWLFRYSSKITIGASLYFPTLILSCNLLYAEADPCSGSPDCICSGDFPLSGYSLCSTPYFICEGGTISLPS